MRQESTRIESKVKGIFIVSEMYRFLMIVAAFTVSLAHGSNDVANAITPLLVVQQAWYQYKNGETVFAQKRGYWLGASGIAIGLLTLGKPCMETIGKKIIKLSFIVGFCAQFATAITIIIGSMYGLPLSTTHSMVGSLLGIVIARMIPFCKYSLVEDDQRAEVDAWLEKYDTTKAKQQENKLADVSPNVKVETSINVEVASPDSAGKITERSPKVADVEAGQLASADPAVHQDSVNFGLNGKLFIKIFSAWIITVPVAFSVSYMFAVLLEKWNHPSLTMLM
jgi:phosphate/sulfate permease